MDFGFILLKAIPMPKLRIAENRDAKGFHDDVWMTENIASISLVTDASLAQGFPKLYLNRGVFAFDARHHVRDGFLVPFHC